MGDPTIPAERLVPMRAETPVATTVHRTIAGRYRLLTPLGSGGFGTVWRAQDSVTKTWAAVKLLSFSDAGDVRRFRDEVALLRLLDLPGVVRLLDDGVDAGTPFLVTEIVEGSPFPRAPRRDATGWDAIAQPTFALLEALSRVHHAGVVHRDLKPANVLVSAEHKPTILDFGVSWGPGFSDSEKGGHVAGTPAYLAPEQAIGRPGDDRTDLYTLGVMLFESLSGRLPHRAASASELLVAKVNTAPMSLREVAPWVPVHVSTTIDQMLSLRPNARPGSAATVLEMLGGAHTHRDLARLGDPTLVERIGVRLLNRESIRVFGNPGSGRTRLLGDVGEWLRERHANVVEINAMTYPEDLAKVPEPAPDFRFEGDGGSGAAPTIVMIEDTEELDDLVVDALEDVIAKHTVLRLVDAPAVAEFSVPRLLEEDLRDLFHGPDLVLHLKEDGAHELAKATDGTPRNVLHVLAAWERAGLCHWDGDKVRIERESLDRLQAGLQVHTSYGSAFDGEDTEATDEQLEIAEWIRLAGENANVAMLGNLVGQPTESVQANVTALIQLGAVREHGGGGLGLLDTLPRNSRWSVERTQQARKKLVANLSGEGTTRFVHLLKLGDVEGVVQEAERIAAEAERNGRVVRAFAVVGQAIALASREGEIAAWDRLLGHYVTLGLSAQCPRRLDLALYACSRAVGHVSRASSMWQLLDAARIVRYVERSNERGLRTARGVREFEDLALDRWRRAIVFQAGYCLSPQEHFGLGDEALQWAADKSVDVRASVRGWVGNTYFRLGDYESAAECHLFGFENTTFPMLKAVSGANAARALMECHRHEEALAVAHAAAEQAAEIRGFGMELRALWLGRAVAYRTRQTDGADAAFVEVAHRASPSVRSVVLMTESAAAWRAGRLELGGELAIEAARAFDATGQPASSLVMRGLAYRCGALERTAEVDAELEATLGTQPEWMADQLRVLWSSEPLGPDSGERMDILSEGELLP